MIISPGFVWLHFPKCAGTFTEKLLRKVALHDGTILFDPINPAKVIWHQNVQQRERVTGLSLSGRDVICNFRRLPHWMISRIQFENQRSGHVVLKDRYTLGFFLDQEGIEKHADMILERYTEKKVDHWIRVEYLSEDFFKIFSKYFAVDYEVVESFVKTKINTSGWDGDLSKWFGPEDLEMLYESCPKWTALEMELYGDLATARF